MGTTLWLLAGLAVAQTPVAIRTGVGDATKDKPQSKLWFAQGTWWALLPDTEGVAIWRRAKGGWERQTAANGELRGLPGQADVWADGDDVAAVLVGKRRIAFVRMRFHATKNGYRTTAKPVLFGLPKKGSIETATIARDGDRRWWIAYDYKDQMWVRSSLDSDGKKWTDAIKISEQPAKDDDICAIVALPAGVGVIWSDQAHDAVYFRFHANGQAAGKWNPIDVVSQGNRTADDHFNGAVAEDGTLYFATKNSVDLVGHPQLVLRVREPGGRWQNLDYALRTSKEEPSRPAVLLRGNHLFLLHTIYQRGPGKRQSYIAWQSSDTRSLRLEKTARPLIEAGTSINNVTGAKARLPQGLPWIVLASDAAGNVYEAAIPGN